HEPRRCLPDFGLPFEVAFPAHSIAQGGSAPRRRVYAGLLLRLVMADENVRSAGRIREPLQRLNEECRGGVVDLDVRAAESAEGIEDNERPFAAPQPLLERVDERRSRTHARWTDGGVAGDIAADEG